MVFGGLTAMFYGSHSTLSMATFVRKVDIRTFFFVSVCIIVLLVLAYLTNPSETSFRSYLTEQSFRQHLSRLDDGPQDDQANPRHPGLHYSVARRSHQISRISGRLYDPRSPFHFVNRASISLRTPKHVFHSFGILTIAAVFPSGPPQGRAAALRIDGFTPAVNDSWFIGAFGKWWRGGTIRAWCHDALVNPKDTERLNSGILDVKALDTLECYDGLPFTSNSTSLHLPSTDSTSKFRGTERPLQRSANNSLRSTTPPPLPKSASLPLHVPRTPATPPKGDRSSAPPTQASGCNVTDQLVLNTPPSITYTPSSSSLFDQSPAIAEILRQISQSKASVLDLRTQLIDVRAAASQSHATIQSDLEAQRERKRIEDASRLELKTTTKILEDSKRAAESSKRDAEKRLRAAESARDSASQRIERLDKEIDALQARVQEDEQAVACTQEESARAEKEVVEELDRKQKEIKVAEDVVAALTSRAKELEERIVQEEERLKRAKEQAELRKQDRSFYPLHVVTTTGDGGTSPWLPIAAYNQAPAPDPHLQINTDFSAGVEVFPPALQVPPSIATDLVTGTHAVSPRPKTLSLGGISNFRDQARAAVSDNDVFLRPQAFRYFSDNLSTSLSSGHAQSTRFSPFSDNDTELSGSSLLGGEAISPRSSSLIPTGLIKSMESSSAEDVSRSFSTEDDAVMEPNWRAHRPPPPPVEHPTAYTASPTSITNPSFDGVDQEDPFEIRPPPLAVRRRLTSDAMDLQRAVAPFSNRAISEPQSVVQVSNEDTDASTVAHRRWHSAEPKEKKGLNPEAKVFRLTKKSLPTFFPPQTQSYDSMPPPPPAPLPTPLVGEPESLLSSISMRAFAPSPAEREALKRALGSSSNTSLERLPTLSEVSLTSMPSSPSHAHALAAQRAPGGAETGRTPLPPGLAWLQSLPRMRKPAFSPWEDEVAEGQGGGAER